MSVPRITQILEGWVEDYLSKLDSADEATRKEAASGLVAFATLRELRKIRMILEDETGTEISDDDIDEDEENV